MSRVDALIRELCPEGVAFKHLWEVTIWDKRFNSVEKAKQIKTIKFPHVSAKKLKEIETLGDVKLLSTGKFDGWTNEQHAASSLGQDEVITVPSGGSANLKYWNGKFVDSGNLLATSSDISKYNLKYIYYFLLSKNNFVESCFRGSGVKHPDMGQILEMKVPAPPVEVQKEIASILDKFTQLVAELSAELSARRKQYEYYRNQLLSFDHSVSVKKLHQISEIYDSLHQTPKYSGEGWPMIRVTDIKGGYVDIDSALKVDRETFEVFTKKYKPQFNDIVVSRVGSYGNFSLIGNDGEVCLGQNTAIMHPLINAKYLYYFLHSSGVTKFIENNVGGGSQKTISLATIKEIPIHVPSPEEQARIVDILDKFDSLTSSVSEGLPAEINARRKQYEYYRTKLLTFQELSV